jgi:hypothetical protein
MFECNHGAGKQRIYDAIVPPPTHATQLERKDIVVNFINHTL